jgi:enoyl-CoA hydratase
MPLVRYELSPVDGGAVATLTMDDGKVNVMTLPMPGELRAALDRAAADEAVVLITGREGVLSAGFDLPVLRRRDDEAAAMVRGGFELSARLLGFPSPVVIACPGHAIAMGLFLLLSADYRIGAAGPAKLVANEVAIGLPLPSVALEILRHRLTPSALGRASMLAEPFGPANAVEAGILDRVVAPDELVPTATGIATALAGLDRTAHTETKRRLREPVIAAMRAAMSADGIS